jgi:hypothetical protein
MALTFESPSLAIPLKTSPFKTNGEAGKVTNDGRQPPTSILADMVLSALPGMRTLTRPGPSSRFQPKEVFERDTQGAGKSQSQADAGRVAPLFDREDGLAGHAHSLRQSLLGQTVEAQAMAAEGVVEPRGGHGIKVKITLHSAKETSIAPGPGQSAMRERSAGSV